MVFVNLNKYNYYLLNCAKAVVQVLDKYYLKIDGINYLLTYKVKDKYKQMHLLELVVLYIKNNSLTLWKFFNASIKLVYNVTLKFLKYILLFLLLIFEAFSIMSE